MHLKNDFTSEIRILQKKVFFKMLNEKEFILKLSYDIFKQA